MKDMDITNQETLPEVTEKTEKPLPQLPLEMVRNIYTYLPEKALGRAIIAGGDEGRIAKEILSEKCLRSVFVLAIDPSRTMHLIENANCLDIYESLAVSFDNKYINDNHVFTSFSEAQQFWSQRSLEFCLVELKVAEPFKKEALTKDDIENNIVGFYSQKILSKDPNVDLSKQNPHTCLRNGNLFVQINPLELKIHRAIEAHKKDIELLTSGKSKKIPELSGAATLAPSRTPASLFALQAPNEMTARDKLNIPTEIAALTTLVGKLEEIKQTSIGPLKLKKQDTLIEEIKKSYEAAMDTMKNSSFFRIQRLLHQGLQLIGLNLNQKQITYDKLEESYQTYTPPR